MRRSFNAQRCVISNIKLVVFSQIKWCLSIDIARPQHDLGNHVLLIFTILANQHSHADYLKHCMINLNSALVMISILYVNNLNIRYFIGKNDCAI